MQLDAYKNDMQLDAYTKYRQFSQCNNIVTMEQNSQNVQNII